MRNKDFFFSFLTGFADAEGCFFLSRGRAGFALGNYNYPLLLQIKNKLANLGILTQKITNDHLEGYKGSDGYKRRADYFNLRCQRKKYLLLLANMLLRHMKHPDKQKNAVTALKNISKRNLLFGNLRMS